MTCHAIYGQKARTKSKDIGGSDRLTAVCVCQRVKWEKHNLNLSGTACQRKVMGVAWEWHGMCELALGVTKVKMSPADYESHKI
jgi:hypothetical protein